LFISWVVDLSLLNGQSLCCLHTII